MTRGNQIVRQWRVLRALERSRRGLSVAELHEQLEKPCSIRTLYRDLEALADVGFPLVEDDNRWRVLQVDEGAWTIPVRATELMALVLAEELLSPARGTWLAAPLTDIRQRLTALLTPEGRSYLDELRDTAVATLFAPASGEPRQELLETLYDAIRLEQVLRMVYASPGKEPRERLVEPYSTWFHAGQLYLIAWCRSASDRRTFAVPRIVEAQVLDETFEPDPGFDAAAFVRKGFGVFHGPVYRFHVELAPEVAHLVRERRFHPTQEVHDLPDGGARMIMEAAGLPEVAAWVAGFGGKAKPVAPEELVQAVRELHQGGLAVMG